MRVLLARLRGTNGGSTILAAGQEGIAPSAIKSPPSATEDTQKESIISFSQSHKARTKGKTRSSSVRSFIKALRLGRKGGWRRDHRLGHVQPPKTLHPRLWAVYGDLYAPPNISAHNDAPPAPAQRQSPKRTPTPCSALIHCAPCASAASNVNSASASAPLAYKRCARLRPSTAAANAACAHAASRAVCARRGRRGLREARTAPRKPPGRSPLSVTLALADEDVEPKTSVESSMHVPWEGWSDDSTDSASEYEDASSTMCEESAGDAQSDVQNKYEFPSLSGRDIEPEWRHDLSLSATRVTEDVREIAILLLRNRTHAGTATGRPLPAQILTQSARASEVSIAGASAQKADRYRDLWAHKPLPSMPVRTPRSRTVARGALDISSLTYA